MTALTSTVTAVASRHQRIRPYTPRHNGKVERYNRIPAEELLYALIWHRESQRAHAIEVRNITTTTVATTPPSETNHQPHDSTAASPTS